MSKTPTKYRFLVNKTPTKNTAYYWTKHQQKIPLISEQDNDNKCRLLVNKTPTKNTDANMRNLTSSWAKSLYNRSNKKSIKLKMFFRKPFVLCTQFLKKLLILISINFYIRSLWIISWAIFDFEVVHVIIAFLRICKFELPAKK